MKITGDKEVIRQLLSMKDATFRRVVDAVEKTAVRMANHAKAGHEHGSDPHSRSRYENQTGNLTASIFPGNGQPMQFQKLTEDMVVGLFGVDAASAVGASMHYAEYVEEKYPFIWPAAVANMKGFRDAIREAAKPRTK